MESFLYTHTQPSCMMSCTYRSVATSSAVAQLKWFMLSDRKERRIPHPAQTTAGILYKPQERSYLFYGAEYSNVYVLNWEGATIGVLGPTHRDWDEAQVNRVFSLFFFFFFVKSLDTWASIFWNKSSKKRSKTSRSVGCLWAALSFMAGCTAISQVEQFATILRGKKVKKERILHPLNLLNFFSPICKAISALTVAFRAEEICLRQIQPRQTMDYKQHNTSDGTSNKGNGFRETVTVLKTEAELQKWVISERLHEKGCVYTFFCFASLWPHVCTYSTKDSPFSLWRYTCSTESLSVESNAVHSRAATGTEA